MKEQPASVINTLQACQDPGPRENRVGGLRTEQAMRPFSPCISSNAAQSERGQWISSSPLVQHRGPEQPSKNCRDLCDEGPQGPLIKDGCRGDSVRAAADGSLPFKTQK